MKDYDSKFWPDGTPKRHCGRSKKDRYEAYMRRTEDAIEQTEHPFRDEKFGDRPLDQDEVHSYLSLLISRNHSH